MTLLGDVGVPPAVEMGIDVTWGDAPLWYAPFSDHRGVGVLETLLGTMRFRRYVQGGRPVSVSYKAGKSQGSDHWPRVGSSCVAGATRRGPGGVRRTGVLLVSRVGWQEAETLTVGRGLGRLV